MNFDFERIKVFNQKQNESIFLTYCCKSLMNLNNITNFFRENKNLKFFFKIFESLFFTYCSIFFVLIEMIIKTAEKIEKTNCKFCCFETVLIIFFHKQSAADKKRISKNTDFFSKIMKRFTNWKIMFFFYLKCFSWKCENHQHSNMF